MNEENNIRKDHQYVSEMNHLNTFSGNPQPASQINQSTTFIGNGQPVAQWMVAPAIANCPLGLEYLTQIDQLLIKQQIEILEVVTGMETNNRYAVCNALGQLVFFAKEDTDCCMRYWCGSNRRFKIEVFDNSQRVVMEINRPFKCRYFGACCNCSKCSRDEIVIESPPGEVIGYVRQLYEGCNIRYAIHDQNDNLVLRIHGPSYCYCYCPGDDFPFHIMSATGDIQVGKISKHWSGLIQEYYTNADNFGVQFPMDLDVKIKAVILGAVFLIDFMYFEDKQAQQQSTMY